MTLSLRKYVECCRSTAVAVTNERHFSRKQLLKRVLNRGPLVGSWDLNNSSGAGLI